MQIFIETERLYCRAIGMEDAEQMFILDSNEHVHEYLGKKPVKEIAEIYPVIKFIQQQYQQNGIGRWALIEKTSNQFIGWAGLKYITEPINNNLHYYDLGYRLQQQYWGKGYATEITSAIIDYAFGHLKLEKIFAIADCKNIASNRVLIKNGFTITETFLLNEVAHNWLALAKTPSLSNT